MWAGAPKPPAVHRLQPGRTAGAPKVLRLDYLPIVR